MPQRPYALSAAVPLQQPGGCQPVPLSDFLNSCCEKRQVKTDK